MMSQTISEIIEKVKADMCDHYCIYTHQPLPDGRSEDWLLEDDDSPCKKCPLLRL